MAFQKQRPGAASLFKTENIFQGGVIQNTPSTSLKEAGTLASGCLLWWPRICLVILILMSGRNGSAIKEQSFWLQSLTPLQCTSVTGSLRGTEQGIWGFRCEVLMLSHFCSPNPQGLLWFAFVTGIYVDEAGFQGPFHLPQFSFPACLPLSSQSFLFLLLFLAPRHRSRTW